MVARNKPESATDQPFKRNLALIIGIDDYQNGYPELKTAVNDARAVASLLAQHPHNYQVTTLIDGQATTTGLKNTLDKTTPGSWASQIGPEDRVLVYFAGHGIKAQSEEGQGPAGFLLLQNADHATTGKGRLGMVQLQTWLADLPCRHLLVVLDCCFAGAMRWSAPGTRDIPPEVIHKERYDHYVEYPAWQLITSAGDDEKAMDIVRQGMETPPAEIESIPEEKIPEVLRQIRERSTDDNHSPFAKALIEALRDGAGDIYPPGQPGQPAGDGLITASELIIYLENRVSQVAREAKHRQVPKLHPLAKHSSGEFVFFNPNREMQLKPAPDLDINNNPYRTDALTEADAELFNGREAEVNNLLENVTKQPLTLVLGPSGVGKSSLVRAGLLPRFSGYQPPKRPGDAEGDEPSVNPDQWRVLPTFIPDENPTEALLDLLQTQLSDDALTDTPPDLPTLLAAWAKANPQRKLLLVVDQLERVLSQPTAWHPTGNPEIQQFLDQLQTLINFEQCHLVLTIREDYTIELEKLLEINNGHISELAPLKDHDDLHRALERPAWARVLYYDPPELVTNVVKQLNRGPGALPLLAAFGSRMYLEFIERGSQSRAITEMDYQEAGSVADFICKAADSIYNNLSQDEGNDEQATVRRVVLRLMDIEGGELNRRRIPRAELDYDSGAEDERVDAILKQLTQARLLVWSVVDGQSHLELAHDALVQDWILARGWRRAEKDEKILLQRRVTKDAREWADAENGKKLSLSLLDRLRGLWERVIADPGEGSVKHLWHDSPYLPQTEQMLEGENWQRGLWRYFFGHVLQPARRFWLNALEFEFIQRSVNRQRRERFLTAYVIAFGIAVLSIITFYAVLQQFEAETQRNIAQNAEATAVAGRDIALSALSRQLAAQSRAALNVNEQELALLLAIEAGEVSDTFEAFSTIRAALRQIRVRRMFFVDYIQQAIWSPDERHILTSACGYDDCKAQIWETETGQEIMRLEDFDFKSATWSENGEQILTVGCSRGGEGCLDQVRVWSLKAQAEIRPAVKLENAGNFWRVVSWSQDGKYVLIQEDRDTYQVWNTRTGDKIGPALEDNYGFVHDGFVYASWSRDGQRILTTSGGTVRIRDVETGETVELPGFHSQANWSQDEQSILTISGSNSNTVKKWGVDSLEELDSTQLNTGNDSDPLDKVVWNPAFEILAALDNEVARVWNIESGEVIELEGHSDRIHSVAWSRDGKRILTSDYQTVRIWNIEPGPEISPTEAGSNPIWDEDEQNLLTVECVLERTENGACLQNEVRILDAETGEEVIRLKHPPGIVKETSWSPDRQYILTEVCDPEDEEYCRGAIYQAWDVETSEEKFKLDSEPMWSPDGKRILRYVCQYRLPWRPRFGEPDECLGNITAEISDVKSDEILVRLDDASGQYTWSKDSKSVLDKNGDLWSVETRTRTMRLEGDKATWSPDEQRILTIINPSGNWNNSPTVQIWNAQTGERLVQWVAHSAKINLATWGWDGQRILTAGCAINRECTVRIWNANTGVELVRLENTGHVTQAAWSRDRRQILMRDDNGVVKIWYDQMADLIATACRRAPRNMTLNEWQQFMGGLYRPTCAQEDTPPPPVPLDVIDVKSGLPRQGLALIQAGQDDMAINLLTSTLKLPPITAANPETAARQYLSEALIDVGKEQAQAGHVETAITLFEKALIFDPALKSEINPGKEAGRLAAPTLVEQGDRLAEIGQVEQAIALYEGALALDPDLTLLELDQALDPEARAGERAAAPLVEEGRRLAENGQIEEALARFEKAAELNPEQGLDPVREASIGKAKWLLAGGIELAKNGLTEEVVSRFEEVLELFREFEFYPEEEIRDRILQELETRAEKQARYVILMLLDEGRESARLGQVDEAIAMLDLILYLDRKFGFDSQSSAEIIARRLVESGDDLVITGELEQAMTLYQRAIALDHKFEFEPEISRRSIAQNLVYEGQWYISRHVSQKNPIFALALFEGALALDYPEQELADPVKKARQLAARQLIEEGKDLAKNGSISEAIDSYDKAKKYDRDEISADDWSTLCLHGSLSGQTTRVKAICEQAVALAPDKGSIRNSRGLNRALSGDIERAIEDFQFYLADLQQMDETRFSDGDTLINVLVDQQEDWIAALKAGDNPFIDQQGSLKETFNWEIPEPLPPRVDPIPSQVVTPAPVD